MDIPSLFHKDAKDDTSADETTATTPRTRKRSKDTGGASASARTPLTASEANKLRDQLVDLLTQGFEDTDKLLSVTSADKASAAIWSTIDDREIEILADAWIDWGKSSAAGAAVVKLVVSQWKRYQVAIILGPRFLETINFYAEHGAALPMKKKQTRTRTGTQAHTQASTPAPAPVDPNVAAEQAQAAHQAQLAARRNLLASGEGGTHVDDSGNSSAA